MNIELMQGHFSTGEAIDLITHMVEVQIRFQENKIAKGINEEDIKFHEAKIKRLQSQLDELRRGMAPNASQLTLQSVIEIQ